MSSFLHQMVTSTTLLTLGMYHLASTTRNYLKSPTTFISKPFHPLPTSNPRFHNLPLHLTLVFLLLSSLYHLLSSFSPDPLLPSFPLLSLHSSSLSFLFFLLLLLHHHLLPFPSSDLFFSLLSFSFFLLSSSPSPSTTPTLQSHCAAISATISSLSSALSLLIALFPRSFFLDAALSASLSLQGLWAFQTGLSLYVDAFIPEGCHRLLDVVPGVDGSTKCELDESRVRAFALLDLAFVVHVVVVVVLMFAVFAVVSKALGVSRRLGGSYEALPTAAASLDNNNNNNQVQLKTMTGTQA